MKCVTNGNGLYGLRKGFWPFYKYFDFKSPGYWWSKSSCFYVDCWTSDVGNVKAWKGIFKPYEVE